MPRLRPMRLGRVAGIPLSVHPTWFVVLAIVGWSLAADYYPLEFPGSPPWSDAVSGVVTALLFFACLTAHEVAHSVVARRASIPVRGITLFLFGGVSELLEEPREPRVEARMALAGPGASLVIAGTFFGLFRASVAVGVPQVVWAPMVTLAVANVVIAAFNLAPGFPMDGGRVLRSFVWWATGDKLLSTRIASLVGQGIGAALVLAGLWTAASGTLSGVWLLLLGGFLVALASRAYGTQLPGLRWAGTPSEALMTPGPPQVPASTRVSEAERILLARPAGSVVVVVDADRLVGIVTARSLAAVPLADPGATLGEASWMPDPAMLVDAGESLETARRRIARSDTQALLVVKGGRLAGELSRERLADPSIVAPQPSSPGQ